MQNTKAKPVVNAPGRNQQTFLFVIIGAAVLLVLAFIVISANSGRAAFDQAFFDAIPQERTEDGAFVLGDPDAPVTIVEFQDWYCPACQQYKPTMDQFIRDYVATGKARYEFRGLTTAGANQQPNTSQEYNLVECVESAKPGSFFYASEVAYELAINGVRGSDFSSQLAERMGIDFAGLLRCTQDEADQITVDQRLAGTVGVSSTPSVLYRINGSAPQQVADRSYSGLAGLVDAFGATQ
jgi:hypothetical protein